MATSPQRIAEILAGYERRLQNLERGPRLANASIHNQAIPIYDAALELRQTWGLQPDGTFALVDTNGPPPPVPTLPTLEARPGTLVVTWDGKFLEDAAAPADWSHVEVHVSTVSGYTPTDENQVTTFTTLKGGSVTLALDAVPQYVVLQAVSKSLTESAPTVEVAGTPLPPASGEGGVQTFLEDEPPVGLDADDDGALWYDTNDGNHPHRWNGGTLAWVSIRDGSIATASAAAASAQTQANSALTAAQAAQATADGSIRTFYQSAAPWANGSSQPPEVVGDLWFDTDDGQAYRWSGTAWVIIEDNSIAVALAAAQNAQTTADGKITSYYQTAIPVIGELGDLWYDTNDGNRPYYCSSVSPLAWTSIRDGTIATAQTTADAAMDAATSDGIAPAASPDVQLIPGIRSLLLWWVAIVNQDPVSYDIHISTIPGFTPTPDTLVATTTDTLKTITGLPGPEPLPGDPDPRALQYDVDYYVLVIARDVDGAAAPGAYATGRAVQATGGDVAFETLIGAHLIGGTVTGREFAGEVFVGNKFTSRVTGTGQGFDLSGDSFGMYRSTGLKKFYVPVSDEEDLFADGEFNATGLTVTGGASFQSGENEVTKDAAMTWMEGVAPPSAAPSFALAYDTVRPSTESLAAVYKTNNDPDWGLGGPFDLIPAEVSHIQWVAAESMWVIHQVRSNGTRAWYFDVNGNPKDRFGTGIYCNDLKEWAVWSTTELTTSSTPAKNGTYAMFRFIPGGNVWYVSAPMGINKYTRLNSSGTPALVNNGQDVAIAEVIGSSLNIGYRTFLSDAGGIPNVPAASSSYTSATGFATSLCAIEWSASGFDFGAGGRYVTAERGVAYSARTIVTSGSGVNSLYPGPSGTPWSPDSGTHAETWESPTSSRRGMAWNGSNFFTYGGDGYLYTHTGERWNPATTSSIVWGRSTFADTDAGGTGLHETTPGGPRSFTYRRRAKIAVTMPAIPDAGGNDDPNEGRLYMARGASLPANAAMHLQYSGSALSTTVTTLATATASPPTTNTFPGANPGRGQSAALSTDGDPKYWFDGAGQGRWESEDWREVGAVGQPAFGAGWTNHPTDLAPLSFLKDRTGAVYLVGTIRNSASPFTTVNVFTLPGGTALGGYVPKYSVYFRLSENRSNESFLGVQIVGRNGGANAGLVRVISDLGTTYPVSNPIDINVSFHSR